MAEEKPLGEALIDAVQFQVKLGIRDSRFRELVKEDPNFPQPIKRGSRYTRWSLAEADNYIRGLLAQRVKVAA